MHKCLNNTTGNIYHLEQWVDNFFPYSQKQLGFDKPVTIIFQSDEENAGRMLGKTAYYDPTKSEIVLYTDNRHPKDVMRSLSHELVHHNQKCRGDFTESAATYSGYAQADPHMRNMEKEAYTKGNLIFRDFEDLIKTGKINIEIDFSDSGEPAMSLKEWKNNEINTKLMKKWNLLKEGSGLAYESKGEEENDIDEGCPLAMNPEDDLEEGDDRFAKMADAKPTLDDLAAPPRRRAGREHRGRIVSKRDSMAMGENLPPKISIREAKLFTQRILERVKQENK